jgi:hypothetical protein
MERASTAGAHKVLNIEVDILPSQMIGKRMPSRPDPGFIGRRDLRMTCLCTSDIGVDIFQAKRQLIAVYSFRSPPKLGALQALDDEPKTVHFGTGSSELCVIFDHLCSKLAHQPMQFINIERQRGEIEIHV